MRYTILQRNLIERGLCVQCAAPAAPGRVRCFECHLNRRRHEASSRTRRVLDESVASISMKAQILRVYEWIGAEANADSIKRLARLEREDKLRFEFFRALWNERKWTLDEYPGASRRDDLNELLTDCLRYAIEIPDPIAELRSFTAPREYETRNQSITALAMDQFDGMTADDFAAVNHLY